MPQNVNLGMVDVGCSKIDESITLYNNAKNCINEATELLGCNSLKFGGVNSTLDAQLDILRSNLDKCSNMNDGVTSTIKANARAQYDEYMAWLQEQNNKDKSKGDF